MPPQAEPAQTVDVVEKPTAKAQRRAALLQLRLEDAAGRLVLRLLELRQHERLLVGLPVAGPGSLS